MQQFSNQFQSLDQQQFPAFPVVFQHQNLQLINQDTITNQTVDAKNNFKLPQLQIKNLKILIQRQFKTSYAQLFKQTWEKGTKGIQHFFQIYQPLNIQFVKELKQKINSLKFVRLSSHKIYVGQFQNNKCSGKSIIIFKNGNIYEGQMKQNKRQGRGFYLLQGVGYYQGIFINDIKTQKGQEVNFRKWGYTGQYQNGLRHGKGLYYQKNANVIYYGQWKMGIIHGKGILKSSQSIYNGIFINSLRHGQGEQKFTNGDSYKGQYQNNRFDGFGYYHWKQGDAYFQGNFKNGLRHGKGKWSSGQTKYSGNYSEGLKQGYGELYYPSGNFYKGNFVEDLRENYGEMFWTDSSFYKGEWKKGYQNGKGQIYIAGGQIITGIFQNSILVQVTPSIYQKQIDTTSADPQQLFGSDPRNIITNKTKTFSQSKKNVSLPNKNKLTKIQESSKRKVSIKDNIYFKSPEAYNRTNNFNSVAQVKLPNNHHSHHHDHSHDKTGGGRQCKCMKRLQNFRLRQRIKTKINQSKVDKTLQDN